MQIKIINIKNEEGKRRKKKEEEKYTCFSFTSDGDKVTTKDVFVFPPRLSSKRRVNLESRYGICALPFSNARIQLPKHDND